LFYLDGGFTLTPVRLATDHYQIIHLPAEVTRLKMDFLDLAILQKWGHSPHQQVSQKRCINALLEKMSRHRLWQADLKGSRLIA
jgi:hypothetical protein